MSRRLFERWRAQSSKHGWEACDLGGALAWYGVGAEVAPLPCDEGLAQTQRHTLRRASSSDESDREVIEISSDEISSSSSSSDEDCVVLMESLTVDEERRRSSGSRRNLHVRRFVVESSDEEAGEEPLAGSEGAAAVGNDAPCDKGATKEQQTQQAHEPQHE